MRSNRWRRDGTRFYRRNASRYQAMIFGAPAPHCFWAWAVWASKSKAEGVEFSLARARTEANAAILDVEIRSEAA